MLSESLVTLIDGALVFDQSEVLFHSEALFFDQSSLALLFDQSGVLVFDQSGVLVFDQSGVLVFDQSAAFVFDQSDALVSFLAQSRLEPHDASLPKTLSLKEEKQKTKHLN